MERYGKMPKILTMAKVVKKRWLRGQLYNLFIWTQTQHQKVWFAK